MTPLFVVAAAVVLAADAGGPGAVPVQHTPWFWFVSAANVHPRLESERYIKEFLNLPLHAIAPGYDDVRTIGDLRDAGILWVPYLGFGKVLSRKWGAFVQAGYSQGKVRTKADDRTWLWFPIHTDFEIERGAAYLVMGVDYFPWGMPRRERVPGLWNTLRAARPGIGLRNTWTYATYKAMAKIGFPDFGNPISLHLSDSWFLPSLTPVIDLDIPLDRDNMLHLDAGYSFFDEQQEDFEGPVFSIGLKHFFK